MTARPHALALEVQEMVADGVCMPIHQARGKCNYQPTDAPGQPMAAGDAQTVGRSAGRNKLWAQPCEANQWRATRPPGQSAKQNSPNTCSPGTPAPLLDGSFKHGARPAGHIG